MKNHGWTLINTDPKEFLDIAHLILESKMKRRWTGCMQMQNTD